MAVKYPLHNTYMYYEVIFSLLLRKVLSDTTWNLKAMSYFALPYIVNISLSKQPRITLINLVTLVMKKNWHFCQKEVFSLFCHIMIIGQCTIVVTRYCCYWAHPSSISNQKSNIVVSHYISNKLQVASWGSRQSYVYQVL